MNLDGVRNCWDYLAKKDPVGAMLPADLKTSVGTFEELFVTGKREIDEVMEYIRSFGVNVGRRRALDFGCGVGRSSQALAAYFDEIYGVDIAPSMIELANKYNCYPERCKYSVNAVNDLRQFDDNCMDLVWCYGVLHLVEPVYFENYIREFFRVVAPGGLVVFQQSAGPGRSFKGFVFRIIPKGLLNLYRRFKYGFEAYTMGFENVVNLVNESGGVILDSREDHRTPGPDWIGYQYFAMKKGLNGVAHLQRSQT